MITKHCILCNYTYKVCVERLIYVHNHQITVASLMFPLFTVIVRTVFEYSRIQLNATQQLQNSAYVLTPVLSE